MNFPSIKHPQQGLTLLEILVAITLGTFLLAGVLKIFTSSKQSYRMQENMSRMQENGRFAMEFIGQDVREADFRACDTVASAAGSVAGADNIAAILPLTVATDSITITQLPTQPAPASACVVANAGICVPDACTAVCTAACPLVATSVAYWIQADTSGQPALFKGTAVGAVGAQALIEGVENMQILYGEDTDGIVVGVPRIPNYYVDAATVVNMANVVGIRITLTARTIDDNLIDNLNAFGDRRLRQTYSTTISLRNRNRIQ